MPFYQPSSSVCVLFLIFLIHSSLAAASLSPNLPICSDTTIYELLISKRKNNRIVKRLKIGDKIAFWLENNPVKQKGILMDIQTEQVLISNQTYPISSITALSKGRYNDGVQVPFYILGLISLYGSLLGGVGLGALAETSSGSTSTGTIIAIPAVLILFYLSSKIFALPPKWKKKKFKFMSEAISE